MTTPLIAHSIENPWRVSMVRCGLFATGTSTRHTTFGKQFEGIVASAISAVNEYLSEVQMVCRFPDGAGQLKRRGPSRGSDFGAAKR
jgi:hypothetical protein